MFLMAFWVQDVAVGRIQVAKECWDNFGETQFLPFAKGWSLQYASYLDHRLVITKFALDPLNTPIKTV